MPTVTKYKKGSWEDWLRKKPQPKRVVLRNEEGEERAISIEGKGRTRWAEAEKTVTAAAGSGFTTVQCLDESGAVLRTEALSENLGEVTEAIEDKREAANFRGMAAVVDSIARNHNEAFDRGSAASAAATESLIAIVETLTGNLNIAITNLHNMAANLANILQGKDPEEGQQGNHDLLIKVLGAAVTRAIGSGAIPMPGHDNGKPKGKSP